mgnify:CR=1 FL=1
MTDRHVIFTREQLLVVAKQLVEFEKILAVDYVFTDSGEPIRMEYLWEDE